MIAHNHTNVWLKLVDECCYAPITITIARFEWDENKDAENQIQTVRFTYRRKMIRIIGLGYWRKGKADYEKENCLHR